MGASFHLYIKSSHTWSYLGIVLKFKVDTIDKPSRFFFEGYIPDFNPIASNCRIAKCSNCPFLGIEMFVGKITVCEGLVRFFSW